MGLAALFMDWTGDANGIDYIQLSEWFEADGSPWWLGFLAILAIAGLVFIGIASIKKMGSAELGSGTSRWGTTGGVLLACCPVIAHVAGWVWLASQNTFGFYSVDVSEAVWETDGPGLWVALAGGIIAIVGAVRVSPEVGRP